MTSARAAYLAVIRGGETEVFRTLQERVAKLDLADVIWDRRTEERRTTPSRAPASERRRRDRRGTPPVTWAPLGFVLVTQMKSEPG